ncbi:major facilitator superfamily domain-containing protein [Amylostereum chailletii]|nr:major facilitator superfamily domain-containing protein [Amylostereum chailletii]
MASVAPQILIPLAADLAPPARRASAISIVLSGLLFGVLIARVVAGVIAQFASWRVVYFMAIGVQVGVLGALWITLPDYPAKNAHLTYLHILYSMAKLAVTTPRLIQACFISMASSACFTCFWVTLTFLLGGEPYNYSTLVIGLFGLIGMAGVSTSPFTGRLIDRLVPWYATLMGCVGLLCVQAIYVGAAGINVGAVVVVTVGLDVLRQMQQVSLTTAVYAISVSARSRLNAVLILAIFIGQVMGTAVGTKVFVEHGWRASGWLMFALTGFQLGVLLLRGPHVKERTWLGYEGGVEWRKSVVMERERAVAASQGETEREEKSGGPPLAEDRRRDGTDEKADPSMKV